MRTKSFDICAFPQYKDQTIPQTEALDIAMKEWLYQTQFSPSFEIVRTEIGSMPGRYDGQERMIVIVFFNK